MKYKRRITALPCTFGVWVLCLAGLLAGCGKKTGQPVERIDYTKVDIPSFNADSAYHYVDLQCSYGPRTPQSEAAKACGDMLIEFFKLHADTVYVQSFDAELWNKDKVSGRNIIASFNLESTDRVLLAAHWDSRMWADHDPDAGNHRKPILGANDGASGVGVLMEIARVLKQKNCNQGVDIILFDLEDQGAPEWAEVAQDDQSDWCMGSQYWAQNLHIPFYRASYGILLDMVGYSAARFTKEGQSMNYASSIMNKVWDIAAALGYGDVFVSQKTGSIMDDHIWVNIYAKIPMIDIVQNDVSGSFFPYWHTVKDDMSNIDKKSLKKVGDVCLTAIYSAQ